MTNEQKKDEFIFVYGTLRSDIGSENDMGKRLVDQIAKDCMFVGASTVKGTLYDVGNFPAIVDGDTDIRGELWQVNNHDLMQQLDWFEGEGNLYKKKLVSVTFDGIEYQAWCYFFLRDTTDLELIECGDYLEYLQDKE